MTSRGEKPREPDPISTEGPVAESRRVVKGVKNPLTDLVGTTNQIIITVSGLNIIISTPQNIDTNADVEFDSLTLGDLTANRLVATDIGKKLVSINSVRDFSDAFFLAQDF